MIGNTMRTLKIALAALLLVPTLALAQVVIQPPSSRVVSVSASSGTVAAGVATATLAAGTQGETTHICGFAITSTGSTAAAVVAPTVAGLNGGTQTYAYASVAGATLSNAPLIVTFANCIPASAPQVAIAVSVPSLGAGSTNSTVNAWGFRLAAHD